MDVATGHVGLVHDAQFDYYGSRLATCSSDQHVKIFEVREDGQREVADLTGHTAAVWQVAWAHPRFGSMLASVGFDRRVIVWREEAAGKWGKSYVYERHGKSVNSISFAPQDQLRLAAGSSDGYVSVHSQQQGKWTEPYTFQAHAMQVLAVSWSPAMAPGSLTSKDAAGASLLATASADHTVRIWKFAENGATSEGVLEGHKGPVRDVAWAPNVGLPYCTLASADHLGNVFIWRLENGSWLKDTLPPFNDVVWRVSWSVAGNVLAVACGDHKVSLWKEALGSGTWKCLDSD